ncbi:MULTISPECIES: cold shock domain-containing protein [unclassified Streptomyces]|uniref:cold-shock protein n=1 Tax=unclassified Streptomyces TaxID=2593676 RepID=UPI002DD810DD|nr:MULTISPECIES: cold shock domain-containing protein [unclassified Streptomyces]WSA90856.1 cold shock domain-containing protein [Streptomyces sp. NBC_01795]WSB75178.1 cold shock domain-containing protein [Streptomyces sp. NBC_01775]WSS16539.1 cold shock domain-containing protein [Streptomyces sp. NBC_01186]WSS45355.1 cold shock domain-containing protein [Streptomyces sp. NBC_01187]
MVAGRVVRFDGARGYGFIAPDHGGEDVFLHANDLLIPESFVHTGVAVEFEIEDGDRGLKASSVRLPHGAEVPATDSPFHASAVPSSGPRSEDGEDPMCDVLSVAEYTRSVTELLLAAAPALTGEQILEIRRHLVQFGKNHGWAED